MKQNGSELHSASPKKYSRFRFTFEKKQIVLFSVISILFTLWYCRFLFSPSTEMVGSEITDGFQSLTIVAKNLGIIQIGNVPFGTFWLSDFYGGSIATYFHVSVIPEISHSSLILLSFISGNMISAVKAYVLITLFIAQYLSYKLANFYFRSVSVAWLFSVGYSFSTFYLSQTNGGHYNFLAAVALLPGVLLLFEKLFLLPSRKNMFLASISLVFLFLGDLQLTIFAVYYLILRLGYHFIANTTNKTVLIKRLIEAAVIFSLSVAPLLISFTLLQNVESLSVSSIPTNYISAVSEYFLRSSGTTSATTNSMIYSLYLGLSIFALAALPMFAFKLQSKTHRKNYIFHLITTVFFLLIAIGTPLSSLVTALFVRVPSRGHILIVLSLCMCMGYGFFCLNNYLTRKMLKKHWSIRSKVFTTLLTFGLVMIVFADLTVGMYPITSTVPTLSGGARFIEDKSEDFRSLTYPVAWAYTNYEATLIKHEIVGISVIALRSYPENNELFTSLTRTFNGIEQSSKMDICNFTLLTTLCGVKYVLIEMNYSHASKYTDFFSNASASGYFATAYRDPDSVVYENLYFQGMVFALKDERQAPSIGNLTLEDFSKSILANSQISFKESFNKIELSVNVSEPAYVVLSQPYYPYWTLTGTNSTGFVKHLNMSAFNVNEGTYEISAVFSVADQTLNLYVSFFVPLVMLGLILYADSKRQKTLLTLALAALFACGLLLMLLSLQGSSIASWVQWRGFGPFNSVVFGLGCSAILGSFVGFTKNKLFSFFGASWSGLRKMFYRFAEVFRGASSFVCAARIKAGALDSVVQRVLQLLIAMLLVFLLIANLPWTFSDSIIWLDDSVIWIVLFVVLLYGAKTSVLKAENSGLQVTTAAAGRSGDTYHDQDKSRYLHLGVLGGLAGVCVSGLVMGSLTLYVQDVFSSGFVLCGALSGLGFGALTEGNRKLRGFIGCVFGFVAIVFGLMMTYNAPIVVGYMRTLSSDSLVPVYMWHSQSFAQFLVERLTSMHGLFFAFLGLVAAYLGGSRFSLVPTFKRVLISRRLRKEQT